MKNLKEEKIYVYIALIIGILFVFLTPPFLSPDEDTHFIKAYLIANGKLYPTTSKYGYVGNRIPKQIIKYVNAKNKFSSNMEKKYSYKEYFNEQYDYLDTQKTQFISYSTSRVFPYIYAVPSIGILFSKIMAKIFDLDSASVAYMLQFARLFSLIFTMFIMYHAIRITPVFKKTMIAVALMPMTLFLCSMVTYDGTLISLSLLALAMMFRLIYDKSIKTVSIRDLIILGIIAVILFNVKTIYSFIYVLMFFIPKEKFKNMKGKVKTFAIIIASVLVVSFLLKLPIQLLNPTSSGDSSAADQLNFVLHNPAKYLGYLWYNIIHQRLFLINSTIGLFGMLDTYIPLALITVYIFYLLIIALVDGSLDKNKITWKIKLLFILFSVICVIAIFTVMYISWTSKFMKIGSRDIAGVQGRYFIPLILPVLLIFSNSKIKQNKFFQMVQNNYIIIPIITLSYSIFVIILRFWI